MKHAQSTTQALLATGRVSNLPTILTNCLVANIIIWQTNPAYGHKQFIPDTSFYCSFIISFIVACGFYLGGCFLGDALDANFDRDHKPERPIPSNILSQRTVLAIAIGIILAALALLICTLTSFHQLPADISSLTHPLTATSGLLLSIILYSILHKKSAYFSLPLIGLCRFFLILFSASIALTHLKLSANLTAPVLQPLYLYASAVGIYTICFASVARSESNNKRINAAPALRALMLALPFLSLYHDTRFHLLFLICLALYALWSLSAFVFINKNKAIFVSRSLAGFCLLDACIVSIWDLRSTMVCLASFAIALLLQKFSPAT